MKFFISLIVLITLTTSVFGQGSREDRKEKIKAFKIAYLTERLELSPDEAQTFWPIYNAYDKKMSDIHRTERSVLRDSRAQFETMNEEMAKTTLESIQRFDEQKEMSRKELLNSLKNKLSYKKILILIKAESDFKRDLLRKLKGERKGGRFPIP